MAIQGLRDTSNFVAEARPKNWREGIMLLEPNGMAPLFALTSLLKSKSTDDPEYSWWEKTKQNQRVLFSTSINNTDTTTAITLSSGGTGLQPKHIMRIEESGELVLVLSITSDTVITVQRGFSGTTKVAVNPATSGVNPNMHVVGSSFEEGSAAPSGLNFDPTKRRNYTQIFRNTLEITRTASKTRLRTGDAVKEAKRECLELHSSEIEKALWLGQPFETTFNGHPQRQTGGVASFIDSGNIFTPTSNNLDMETFENYMVEFFRYGSNEKMGWTGNRGMLTIQQMARKNSAYQFMQGQKEFGMNVNRLISPFGTLTLKTHPMFNEVTSGTNTTAYWALDSWLFVLDMKELSYRYVDDTKYEKDLQSNGLDSMKSGYLTECGLEMHFPKAHALVKGLGAGIADT
jgi:hypothetical protein